MRLFQLLAASVTVILLWLIYRKMIAGLEKTERIRWTDEMRLNWTENTKKTGFFFLKTHKCGSSTVQNVLLRLGYEAGLNFILPPRNVHYFTDPNPFNAEMIPELLRAPAGTPYNMLVHHMRLSVPAIKAILPSATWITVLRNPPFQLESEYAFWNMDRFYNKTLEDLVNGDYDASILERRVNNKVGINQVSWDLGLDPKQFYEEEAVNQLIQMVDSTFDLVMINEYMEASLVMLADLMGWPLEMVATLRVNSRKDSARLPLDQRSQDALSKLNYADSRLYEFFLEKFKRRIDFYGRERLENDVKKLIELNEELSRNCVIDYRFNGFSHTETYSIDQNNVTCKYAGMGETRFTHELQDQQMIRFGVLKKTEELFQ